MCTVQYYDIVYPDGSIERKRRIAPCRRGTPNFPCPNLEYDTDSYDERLATDEEIKVRMELPRDEVAPSSKGSGTFDNTSKTKKPRGILRKVFGSKDKAKYVLIQKKAGEYQLTKPRPQKGSSESEPSRGNERLKNLKSNKLNQAAGEPRINRRRPHEVKVHNTSNENEESSSTPDLDTEPRREFSSSAKDPERKIARWREEERKKQNFKQEEKDRAAKELEKAHARAERLHDEEAKRQTRQQDLAASTDEVKTRKGGGPASYHAIPDEHRTDEQLIEQQRQYEQDWERIRAFDRLVAQRQEEEDRQTRHKAEGRPARGDQEERNGRRQEAIHRRARRQEEDQEELNRRRQETEDRHVRREIESLEELSRRTQEAENRHARRQAEDQEELNWRRQETEDRHSQQQIEAVEELSRQTQGAENRRRRQREAGVPRQPRHPSVINDIRNYDPDDFDQQGSDFINSAIRQAEQQETERRAPAVSWSLPTRGRDGLVRRNTIDGSQQEERNGRQRRRDRRDRRSDSTWVP